MQKQSKSMNETAKKIVDTAERMIREGGYHSFSFRQIADELGVKSASVHYHFPTKESLGALVTRQYTKVFLESLGRPEDHKDPLGFYIGAFESSLKTNRSPCLCGVLAAESGRLPEEVCAALKTFKEENLKWLQEAVKIAAPKKSKRECEGIALVIFSALEGAINFAALTKNVGFLTQVGKAMRGMIG